MSSKKPQKMRGPSRPVDPRRAPGPRTQKKGPDTFGIALIAISTVFVLVLIFFLATSTSTTTTTTTGAGTTGSSNTGSSAGTTAVAIATAPASSASPNPTQQEIDFLTQVAGVPRIAATDAIQAYQNHSALFFDVRTADQYKTQHIKGATNIPLADVQTRVKEFPKTGTIIVYCQ